MPKITKNLELHLEIKYKVWPATRENSLRDFELTVNKAMYGSK